MFQNYISVIYPLVHLEKIIFILEQSNLRLIKTAYKKSIQATSCMQFKLVLLRNTR